MEIIEKAHNTCLTEIFTSKSAFNENERECELYQTEYIKLAKELKGMTTANVYGKFSTFYPHVQYIVLDALSREDHPNKCEENSIYLRFKIDYKAQSVEITRYGYIYLTEHDIKASNLCMCSIKECHIKMGGKWMRKSKFKDVHDLVKKIVKAYNSIMTSVEKATCGYPYKQMIVNIH